MASGSNMNNFTATSENVEKLLPNGEKEFSTATPNAKQTVKFVRDIESND